MSTTTVRLPEALKARIDRLAAADGKSSHAFMVDALARAAELRERQLAFDAEVQQRWEEFQRDGLVVTHEDLKAYALALAAGKKPQRPKLRHISELTDPKRHRA
ncbi:MAG: ribbon-helix-helix protein, CopG family [Rubrivivax sp.]